MYPHSAIWVLANVRDQYYGQTTVLFQGVEKIGRKPLPAAPPRLSTRHCTGISIRMPINAGTRSARFLLAARLPAIHTMPGASCSAPPAAWPAPSVPGTRSATVAIITTQRQACTVWGAGIMIRRSGGSSARMMLAFWKTIDKIWKTVFFMLIVSTIQP